MQSAPTPESPRAPAVYRIHLGCDVLAEAQHAFAHASSSPSTSRPTGSAISAALSACAHHPMSNVFVAIPCGVHLGSPIPAFVWPFTDVGDSLSRQALSERIFGHRIRLAERNCRDRVRVVVGLCVPKSPFLSLRA